MAISYRWYMWLVYCGRLWRIRHNFLKLFLQRISSPKISSRTCLLQIWLCVELYCRQFYMCLLLARQLYGYRNLIINLGSIPALVLPGKSCTMRDVAVVHRVRGVHGTYGGNGGGGGTTRRLTWEPYHVRQTVERGKRRICRIATITCMRY